MTMFTVYVICKSRACFLDLDVVKIKCIDMKFSYMDKI